ncbi:MAG: ECF-type sigma factor [Phycisphaerae bacterium]|nr:ECF-type sigma factor [Phycisphaerae bacterium]
MPPNADERLPASALLPLVYAELRALAAARMRSLANGQTLQPTALVHEAYARLVARGDCRWVDRLHFFHSAARAMRDILVESARRRLTHKRGGTRLRESMDNATLLIDEDPLELLALSEAIERLRDKSERQYTLVMLRYFAGLSLEEAASAMGVAERTLRRDWDYIRARLYAEINSNHTDESADNVQS